MPSLTVNYIIEFNPEAFPGGVTADLLEMLAHLEPILLQIAGAFWHEQEQEVFLTEGASVGEPWAPNGIGYAAWKLAATGQSRIGVLSGRLEASIANTMTTGPNSVSIGTDVPYAPDFERDSDDEWTAKYAGSSFSGQGHPGRILIAATQEQIDALQMTLEAYIEQQTGVNDPFAIMVRAVA